KAMPVKAIEEAWKTGASSVGEKLFHAEIAPAFRHDAGYFANLLVVRIAILYGIFGALFVIDIDTCRQAGAIWPDMARPGEAVPYEIPHTSGILKHYDDLAPARRSKKTAIISVKKTITPQTAATRTSRLVSRIVHRWIGSVSDLGSASIRETGTWSKEDRNAIRPPAMTPRLMRGSVTLKNVKGADAPRLAEHSSSVMFNCCNEAPTMRMTSGVQMIT